VGASLSPEQVAAFDEELRTMLADRFPANPMPVMHRVWTAIGVAP
jgi:hypothetical protein